MSWKVLHSPWVRIILSLYPIINSLPSLLMNSLHFHSSGAILTLLLKVLVTKIFGQKTYAVFYKRRPLIGNIVGLAFEGWNTALSVWFVLVRAVKLGIITVMFLGRSDRPLLAQGVGMLGALRK